MNKNIISEKISERGEDGSTVFVFPSDIAASLWIEEALDITGAGTIPAERFVAWDRFKEEAVQANVAGKSPVSSVLRKLYALELAERNRMAEKPFFSSLIPPNHAESGSIFASWIARILPQLGVWERKKEKAGNKGGMSEDGEVKDLAFLKKDYGAFLDSHELFEPAWQSPPLRDTGKRYIIFFPEAIEDYAEYAALLGPSPFIETVTAPADKAAPTLETYGNTRQEISAVALSIEQLIRTGTRPEKIAVSVPDLETVAPYVVRELSLRGIPAEYRAGSPLGKLPAGRLFSLVSQCVSSGFSFASMKSILLDRLVPWKNRDLADGLVGFGIRNHCVSSWNEDGKEVDVWEEAFRTPTRGETADWRLAEFYRTLARSMRQLCSAKTFREIRDRYFSFRETFLDMELLASEDDAVLARCVEELNSLASLEGAYSPYVPQNPFSFFVSTLDEKKYVAQRKAGGVSVFPYRVAAGTPFAHHFVLDASQDSATVIYSQLSFLRQDRRLALNLLDTDASEAFFAVYDSCSARFSFAERSFKGYRTPHGFFTATREGSTEADDPYAMEREWFAAGRQDASGAASIPDRAYPAQKEGVKAWLASKTERNFSYLENPFGERLGALSARIVARQMNGTDIRTSQTDLSLFSVCPARWFLSRILSIEAETSDAELFNERNLGILYHDVLKKIYDHIRETDKAFNAKHLEEYRSKALELAESAAADHAEFRGPIAAPLIQSLVKKITDGVVGMLERDAELLDGFVPEFLEDDIAFSSGGIRYYGKIDRISRRPSDSLAVLIDYKSGKAPSPSAYKTDGNAAISDFQIPMYVFLAEESSESPYHGSKIEFAWFGSIQDGDYRPIINDNDEISHGRKKGMMSREEFEPAMKSFRETTDGFARSVREKDFTRPENLSASECWTCDFRKICRNTYAVRPR